MSQLSRSIPFSFPGGMHGIGLGTSFLGSRVAQRRSGSFMALISSWLKLNPTTIGATLTIFGTIFSSLPIIETVGQKIYSWVISFFTVFITVDSSDKLHREVLSWLRSQVLEPRGHRTLTAQSETIRSDPSPSHFFEDDEDTLERNDSQTEKKAPIEYLPIFESTWFILERKIYLVRHSDKGNAKGDDKESNSQLVIMCLGRSLTPLKRFLKICREYSDKNNENFTQVWTTKRGCFFDSVIKKPHRAIETVYFDQNVKKDLFTDIQNYLDPNNRRFYNARGIPYRRGYLLHGPPGTGKTSLSLALAGHFGLDLFLVHMPSIHNDSELELLFSTLPPLCIVLLEDIDAVGLKRQSNEDSDDDNDAGESRSGPFNQFKPPGCTLSGLLNILDGVASQEGRIVLMTSNFADKLDEALI